MLNLLSGEQTRAADSYTIQHQLISSVDLMERASLAFVKGFSQAYPDKEKAITVYCGTGNNGGDGMAIARLLKEDGYSNIRIIIVRFSAKVSGDFLINYERIFRNAIPLIEIKNADEISEEPSDILIDALLGSGLNKPLEGEWKNLINWLNSLDKIVVAVDIPTGLKSEGFISTNDVVFKSHLTIAFQRPKINFLLPESAAFMDEYKVVDIGLDENYIASLDTSYALLAEEDVSNRLKKRKSFSHKGTYGHALIIAGSLQTMGAALLSSEASVFTGSGLTTSCIPLQGLMALNCRRPEVMAVIRENGALPSSLSWEKYTCVAIGPGLETPSESKRILEETLKKYRRPIVLDADALNLISLNYELMALVPKHSVLTPHVKEFDRLFGEHANWWERLETGIDRATTLGCIIVLKNRYTIIFTPKGKCLFNPTGTPGMASGGMGDVLTGMIASFLAQGYTPEDAAMLGVYLHGKAGESIRGYVVPASELIKEIPQLMGTYL